MSIIDHTVVNNSVFFLNHVFVYNVYCILDKTETFKTKTFKLNTH